MSQISKTVIFFVDPNSRSYLQTFLSTVEAKANMTCRMTFNPDEVSEILAKTSSAVLLLELLDKTSIPHVVVVLRASAALIKAGNLKVTGFNNIKGNKNIIKALQKLGCNEILDDDIKAKSLSFKIDFWFKTLKSKNINEPIQKELAQKNQDTNKGESKSESTAKKSAQIDYTKPIELENDIWIIRHKNDNKNILRRWLVKLIGPSPYVGKWHEKTIEMNGQSIKAWQYVFTPARRELFMGETGEWYFVGTKPEFDWKENIWTFTGSSLQLFHLEANGEVTNRVHTTDDGHLIFHTNSLYAETKKDAIEESFDQEYDFSADAPEDKSTKEFDGSSERININLKGLNGKESNLAGNLEGNSQTDSLSDNPLQGKTNQAEQIDSQLKGKQKKSDNVENDYEGKGSKADRLRTHYDGKSGAQKQAEESEANHHASQADRLRTHYDGKSGSQKETEESEANHHANQADRLRTHYDGKSGAQKETEESEANHHASQADRLKTHYDGKSGSQKETEESEANHRANQADRLRTHYDGHSGSQQEDEAKGPNHHGAGSEKIRTHYDGKSNSINFSSNEKHKRPSETGDISNDNFSALYSDSHEERDFSETDYQRSKKEHPRYHRDDVENVLDPEPNEQMELETITASAEIKAVIELDDEKKTKYIVSFDDFCLPELDLVSKETIELNEQSRVTIYLYLKYLDKKHSLVLNGFVQSTEQIEQEMLINIALDNVDERRVESFMQLYLERQDNIEKFMDKTRDIV